MNYVLIRYNIVHQFLFLGLTYGRLGKFKYAMKHRTTTTTMMMMSTDPGSTDEITTADHVMDIVEGGGLEAS